VELGIMDNPAIPDQLLEFPCDYEFKAFAAAAGGNDFAEAVSLAVNRVVPAGQKQLRTRSSSGGRYQCVTVGVRLENSTQLNSIYANLRAIDGLSYLI
jgi:putative lipoic acid-binding regulatory protein